MSDALRSALLPFLTGVGIGCWLALLYMGVRHWRGKGRERA